MIGKDAATGSNSLERVFTAFPHRAFIQLSRARKGTRANVTILSSMVISLARHPKDAHQFKATTEFRKADQIRQSLEQTSIRKLPIHSDLRGGNGMFNHQLAVSTYGDERLLSPFSWTEGISTYALVSFCLA